MSTTAAKTGPSSAYAAGARALLPLSPAVVLGASFGVLSQSAGFDPAAAIVMSATTFAGSAQFAVISVLGAGGTLVAAVAAAVLLNARYGPDGPRGGTHVLRRARLRRVLVATARGRELGRLPAGRPLRPAADAGRRHGAVRRLAGGTALGVAAGTGLGDPAVLGLDAAFPALFLALMVPLVKSRNALAAAVAGAGLAPAHAAHAGRGPVIAATLAVLFGLFRAGCAR